MNYKKNISEHMEDRINGEGFVRELVFLRNALKMDALEEESDWVVARLVRKMQLTGVQREQLLTVLNEILNEAFYTLVEGLEGEGCIGLHRQVYTLQNELEEEITSGELLAHAYEYLKEGKPL